MHLCWHNRWREDLRHAASDLSRQIVSAAQREGMSGTREYSCALCLLGTLDHVLSWDVATPHLGSSDLVPADWHLYPNFCAAMRERFAFAWAAAQAPAGAELELAGFDSHLGVMAARGVPEGFLNV